MINLPDSLLDRLTEEEAVLPEALALVAEELRGVYALSRADHNRAVGDNAQLFGLKLWHRLWFALASRVREVDGLIVVDANNSHQLMLGGRRIGIHKLGDFSDEDIHCVFPDASTTQRAYGARNNDQLRLFNMDPSPAMAMEHRYGLRDLTIAHFGNPESGLVKWYVGAWTTNAEGHPFWAWQIRQDEGAVSTRPDIVAFDQRQEAEVAVTPRSGQQPQRDSRLA